jgi:outer membrane protein OmpA-like peptidoglycan-associated protein
MANLIQTITTAFTPDVTSKLAAAMGESPSAVTSGVGAAGPALLAGALQRSATPAGSRSLLDLVNQAQAGGQPLDRLGSIASDDSARASFLSHGQGLASGLLGGSTSNVASAISSHSGLGMDGATKLLALVAPVVLGVLGRAAGPSPSASGLQSLLNNERASILGALPPGLGSLFGLGGAGRTASRGAASAEAYGAHATSTGATAPAPRPSGLMRFLPWVVGALVLLGLVFAMRNCAAQRTVTPAPQPAAPTVTTPQATAPTPPAAPTTPTVSLQLPGGSSVNVPEGSIGFGVVKFLQSNDPAPKTFIFDNLNYDTASRALTPESRPTVSSLATILSAYPNATVRVVGYTDNQGDPAANKTLSEQRAATVKSELTRLGIPADRIESAGMGEANPVADNSTDAGRAQNRRTELVILKK